MDAFIGEIRLFAGNYEPNGWLFCNGQTLSISQYQALFSILWTTYGGDGKTNFCLPDLRGRVPLGYGQRPGSSVFPLGSQVGTTTAILTEAQMPSHNHLAQCRTDTTNSTDDPKDAIWGPTPGGGRGSIQKPIYAAVQPDQVMAAPIQPVGGGQVHDNVQPYLGLNYIICCLEGEYPVRP